MCSDPRVTKANVILETLGIATISAITFHWMLRTHASLRRACGDDVRYTADQLGHGQLNGQQRRSRRRDVAVRSNKKPRLSGVLPREADDGIRTHDLLHGKQTL
jgi:hypothetical protein